MGQQRPTRIPRRVLLLALAAALVGLAAYGMLRWRGPGGLAVAAGIVLAVAVAVVLVVLVAVMPGRLAPPIPKDELAGIDDPRARVEVADGRVRLRNDLRNGALQLLVALAVLAGAALGFQHLTADRDQAAADRELARQGQASSRFTQAIDQLGSKRVETRIGGVYGLAQIVEQAPDNNGPVGEVLLAFVNRQPRPKPPPTAPLSEHAPDVQAALTVLTSTYDTDGNGEPASSYGWIAGRLDLHALGLRGATLTGADLAGTDLTSASPLHVGAGRSRSPARCNSSMWASAAA